MNCCTSFDSFQNIDQAKREVRMLAELLKNSSFNFMWSLLDLSLIHFKFYMIYVKFNLDWLLVLYEIFVKFKGDACTFNFIWPFFKFNVNWLLVLYDIC